MLAKEIREERCFATTFGRKYYRHGSASIKRSLRPLEFCTGHRGLHVLRLGKERLKNEAESLQFIQKHSAIPVSTVYCHFEDDQAYYLITEHIEGISMSELSEGKEAVVREELVESQQAKLKPLKSCRLGGPSGIVIPPLRVLQGTQADSWYLRPSADDEYVFCHNNLSQQNVIVDPDTLKMKAIIGWEYSGFFPPHFEYPFYLRLGPSAAITVRSTTRWTWSSSFIQRKKADKFDVGLK